MCLKSNTFQVDSSSTMNIWSLFVDINFTLGLVCPITFASLQARVRLYTGVSVHGGKLTGTSYGGGGARALWATLCIRAWMYQFSLSRSRIPLQPSRHLRVHLHFLNHDECEGVSDNGGTAHAASSVRGKNPTSYPQKGIRLRCYTASL